MNRLRLNGFARTAIGLAVAAVVAPALAQNTTASVAGRILGADGQPVAGATVTVLHVESRTTSNLTTDGEGRYSARGLRVGGPYTVTATKGSLTQRRDNVFLSLADTTTLDIALSSSSQSITVTGAGVSGRIDTSAMGSGTQLSSRDLEGYASISRNLQDYARLDPRLSQTDKERGEISAAGQNTRYNSITIDGVTISDTFGLESNNLPTAKQPISIDAIQSVQVNISNYDVTQKGYTGANINAVTKSGTNEVKGSVYYAFRNDSLVGDRFNRTDGSYSNFLPFTEDTKGFNLGGPIIKDKLFFFASYERLKSNRVQPEFGPVGSALTNVAISQSAIDSMRSIATQTHKFDPGSVLGPSLLDVKDSLIKIDWNINDQHRASLRYTRTQQSETNNGAFSSYTPTSLQMTSAYWQQEKQIDTLVGQWFADWSDNFSTEVKISSRDYTSFPVNAARLPAMALQFTGPAPTGAPTGVNTGSRFLNFGTEQSRHYNDLATETLDAYAAGTYTRGGHEIKFGLDLQDNQVFNAFFQNTLGNYTFSCQNSSTTYTYSFGAINCGTATAAQIEAAVLENFRIGRPSSYQVQLPVPGGSLDNGIARWGLRDTGLFIQDTFKATSRLSITAGVRLDTLNTDDRPQLNTAAAAAPVIGRVSGTTVVRNTGGFGLENSTTIDGSRLVQPRIGFNLQLNPKDERRLQLRGGAGLFQGAAANVWLSNPYSNTGLATRIIGCGISGFSACPSTGGTFSANPDTQPVNFTGASPAANVDFIQPGFNQPAVWKLNLALDAELGGGLMAGVELLHTRTDSGVYYQHLNLGGATTTGADGRQLFWTPQGYDPNCWTATGSSITTGTCTGFRNRALSNASFANVLMASETSKGGGNALTVSLRSAPRAGLSWSVAYTRTTATEVSPLTSSVSNSNFNSRSIFNPNEDVAANSAYLIRDRFSGSLNWSKAFVANYPTSVGIFYEGRRGRPYSWIYRNDLNGDGVINDLMYIPTAPGSGEVEFRGDTATSKTNEDRFWSIVSQFDDLNGSRGKVVSRNSSFAPWVNTFDLRLSQQLPGLRSKDRAVFRLDILNFGNLLNRSWGRVDELAFQSQGGLRRTFVSYGGLNAQGKYVYIVGSAVDDLTTRQARQESQWAVQASLRYDF